MAQLPTLLHGAAFQTPLGAMVALASPTGVVSLGFDPEALVDAVQEPSPELAALEAWLQSYLSRRFEQLPAVPLDLRGTPLDCAVWRALGSIPVGRTATYGDVARRVGRPDAVRAVAAAVGRNPVALVLPCHRVIGADGSLTGYGGGVPRKAWLLRHEGALLL